MPGDSPKFSQEDSNSNTDNIIVSGLVDPFAADLRGFGFIGILSILVILFSGNIFISGIIFIPLGGLFALLWTIRSKTPWSALGYIRPKSWVLTITVGLTLGIGFKLIMKTMVMPLFGANPVNSTYNFLAGNKVMFLLALFFMMVAGLSEETVFRGFLFERLSKLFRSAKWSKTVIVVITASLFGLGHITDQGITGFEQATIVGLVYGIIYASTDNLWMLIVAHAAFDITAVILIYYNLETTAAQFFFN
jgi:uncharacterized protein